MGPSLRWGDGRFHAKPLADWISFRQITKDSPQSKRLTALGPAGFAGRSPGEGVQMHPRHIVGNEFLQEQRRRDRACKSTAAIGYHGDVAVEHVSAASSHLEEDEEGRKLCDGDNH